MRKTTEIDAVIAANLSRMLGDEHGAQRKLAEKVKISAGSLNRIIKGRQHAGPQLVADIAKALGVSETAVYQLQTNSTRSAINADEIAELIRAFARLAPPVQSVILYLVTAEARHLSEALSEAQILERESLSAFASTLGQVCEELRKASSQIQKAP